MNGVLNNIMHYVFIISCSPAPLALPYFSHSFHKRQDIIIKVHWSSCKMPVILSNFYHRRNVSTNLHKIPNKEFHNIPFGWSQVVPCGLTWRI